MGLRPLLAAALVLATWWSVQEAQGNFAASPGFSGRSGFTCLVCHQPPSPTHDDATAVLEGVPDTWDLNTTYTFTIRVEGGPPALPAPAPQGGFDIAVDAGRLSIDGQDDLLRQEGATEITYEPAGTLMRQWHVTWRAPSLDEQPAPATVWVAVIAANGNHVAALEADDLGESLDSTDALQVTIPPSATAIAAWNTLPLLAPTLTYDAAARMVHGTQQDRLADSYRITLDNDTFSERTTPGELLFYVGGAGPGSHIVSVVAAGAGRLSPPAILAIPASDAAVDDGNDADGEARTSPTPPAVAALLLILGLAATHRSKHP